MDRIATIENPPFLLAAKLAEKNDKEAEKIKAAATAVSGGYAGRYRGGPRGGNTTQNVNISFGGQITPSLLSSLQNSDAQKLLCRPSRRRRRPYRQ